MAEFKEIQKIHVNAVLSCSYTQKGVRLWWDRKRHQLDDKTPSEVWDEGDRSLVLWLALDSLAQVAT
jgi:hypothetical protein